MLIDKYTNVALWQAKRVGFAISRDYVLFILGIKTFYLVDINSTDVCDLFKVQILIYLNRICTGRNICFHRANVMIAVVGHYIVGCNKSRYISAGFFGQEIVYIPIIRFTVCAAYGLVNCSRAAVVSCNNKVPVAIYGV